MKRSFSTDLSGDEWECLQLHVPAPNKRGRPRTHDPREILNAIFYVPLFVFEHAGMGKGGSPRHLHHAQDEWFYAVGGDFVFEIGDERFTLRPGDSLFAPRLVPHVWAHVGEEPGTLLLAVQPAGSLEAFFREGCEMTKPPTPEEAARQFAAHGMEVVGPPLDVD